MDDQFPVEWLDPATLRPNPRNPRRHPKRQKEALAASLVEFGWLAVPVFNRRTGRLVDGHARVEEAARAGVAAVPVRVVDVDEATERRILATFDRIAALAETDDALMTSLLRECAEEGALPPGWDEDDLAKLLLKTEPRAADSVAEDEASVAAPSRCEVGEVWRLGDHRLICGDATHPAVWERLLGTERLRCVWTDPPCGVAYADKNEFLNKADRGNCNQRPIQNDALPPEEVERLCRSALRLAAERGETGATCYVACPAGTLLPGFIRAFDASGFQFRHSLVWVKNQFVLGRCDYHYRHEVVLYGWLPGKHEFHGGKAQSSVFEVDKPRRSEDHPTMKPVELIARMVENSTRPGEVVVDPFGGSGTTLSACEQLGRRARLIELEPHYCDVILARWEALTGGRAERED